MSREASWGSFTSFSSMAWYEWDPNISLQRKKQAVAYVVFISPGLCVNSMFINQRKTIQGGYYYRVKVLRCWKERDRSSAMKKNIKYHSRLLRQYACENIEKIPKRTFIQLQLHRFSCMDVIGGKSELQEGRGTERDFWERSAVEHRMPICVFGGFQTKSMIEG